MHSLHRFALPLFLSIFALGCSGSDDDNSSGSSSSGGNSSGSACEEINSLCHDADDGSNDLATECHQVAHVGNEADCTVRREECVSFCKDKEVDSSGHHHHDHDDDDDSDHDH